MTAFNNIHDVLDSVELGHLRLGIQRSKNLADEITALLREQPAASHHQLAQALSECTKVAPSG